MHPHCWASALCASARGQDKVKKPSDRVAQAIESAPIPAARTGDGCSLILAQRCVALSSQTAPSQAPPSLTKQSAEQTVQLVFSTASMLPMPRRRLAPMQVLGRGAHAAIHEGGSLALASVPGPLRFECARLEVGELH